jgi:DNA/RNA endonuclease YhcR with UshA esterase domain
VVVKKITEIIRVVIAADLKVGDKFRRVESTDSWQEIVTLEKKRYGTHGIIVCRTKLNDGFGEFSFEAVGQCEVEILT